MDDAPDRCPTCGQEWATPEPCDDLAPAFVKDVIPLRCVRDKGHHGEHRSEPVWPGGLPTRWRPL